MHGVAELMYQYYDAFHCTQLSREEVYVLGLNHDIGYINDKTGHELYGGGLFAGFCDLGPQNIMAKCIFHRRYGNGCSAVPAFSNVFMAQRCNERGKWFGLTIMGKNETEYERRKTMNDYKEFTLLAKSEQQLEEAVDKIDGYMSQEIGRNVISNKVEGFDDGPWDGWDKGYVNDDVLRKLQKTYRIMESK